MRPRVPRIIGSRRLACGSAAVACLVAALILLSFSQEEVTAGRDEPRAAGLSDSDDSPLIVHEWGTFTSFSGSDGARLEFRPLVTSDLPGFVNEAYQPLFGKRELSAIQRLETPVTYFYTPVERDVEVSVEFPKGLLTEFYPPPRSIAPAFVRSSLVTPGSLTSEEGTGDISLPVEGGRADWGRIHLIPTDRLATQVDDPELAARMGRLVEEQMVPDARGNPYGFARATDSAIVQVRHPTATFLPKAAKPASRDPFGPTVLAADYFEKFLFYRGVGNFDLPIVMTSIEGGAIELRNEANFELSSLFLVSQEEGKFRFTTLDRLPAGESVRLSLPTQPGDWATLAKLVVEALVADGLYQKEAKGMVRTWQDSWFTEYGTRLLYVLPQHVTDELLPLSVSPPPQEIVRVMVGRLEFLPPDVEERIVQIVETSLSEAERDEVPESALAELAKLGRLADPALVRASQLARTPEVRRRAEKMRQALNREAETPVLPANRG